MSNFEISQKEISVKPPEVDNYVKDILSKNDGNLTSEKYSFSNAFINKDGIECNLPRTGKWEGEPGNSVWIPDTKTIPDPENGKGGNPEGKTWEKILESNGIEGIEFKDGYPVFDPVSKADIKIDGFSTDRSINFQKADELCAEKWNKEGKDGKTDWTPRDIANFRKEEGYTWHECEDKKTLQLVPKEVHNNVPHTGGISVAKQTAKETNV